MPNVKGEATKRETKAIDPIELRKNINDLLARAIIAARKKQGAGLIEDLKSIRELVNLYTKINPEQKEEVRYIEIRVIDELDGGDYKRIARVGQLDTTGISEEEKKQEEEKNKEDTRVSQGVMSESGSESSIEPSPQ